jgi:hypothetical protein
LQRGIAKGQHGKLQTKRPKIANERKNIEVKTSGTESLQPLFLFFSGHFYIWTSSAICWHGWAVAVMKL